MGDSNLNCAISKFPIDADEKVICIFVVKNNRDRFYSWGNWLFGSLPFEVTMGDYSSPLGVNDKPCDGSGTGEFDTKNELEARIYKHFRSKVYLYTEDNQTKERKIVENNKREDGWYYIMRYGDWDNTFSGYSPFYEIGREGKLIGRFAPEQFNVMFINKDVFKYITRPFKCDNFWATRSNNRMTEWFDCIDLYKSLREKIEKMTHEETMTAIKEQGQIAKAMRATTAIDRFEFLHSGMCDYNYALLDNNFVGEDDGIIREKFYQLQRMAHRLMDAQQTIMPSMNLAPQGGWGNDLTEMRNFYRKLDTLYRNKTKQRKEGYE